MLIAVFHGSYEDSELVKALQLVYIYEVSSCSQQLLLLNWNYLWNDSGCQHSFIYIYCWFISLNEHFLFNFSAL